MNTKLLLALALLLSPSSSQAANTRVLEASGLKKGAVQVNVGATSGTLAITTGNVATSTALAANPTDCGSDTYATGIDASGNLTCASVSNASTTAASVNTALAIVSRDGSGNFAAGTISAALSGNASTATALAANPSDCSAGQYATTIAANGNLSCAAVAYADVSGTPTPAASTPFTASAPVLRDANGDTLDEDPSYGIDILEEFLGYQSASNGNWLFNGSATGANAQTVPAGGGTNIDVSHPGIAPMSTGTTTTGAASMFSGQTILASGGTIKLEWLMNLSALSDGTNTYTLTMGLCDSFANSVTDCSTSGAYFRYTHGTNSGNLQLKTIKSGSATTTNTSTPMATGWHKFSIEFDAGATLVTGKVDGVSAGTSASNIPNNLASPMLMGFYITKSAGTTAAKMNIDYVRFRFRPTTPR